MKVILVQDVPNLGRKGAAVEVAEGYARNYLVPRGLATIATPGALKSLQVEQQRRAAQAQRAAERARADAAQLAGRTVTVHAKAGDAGRLFGAVTSKDVAEAILRQIGVAVDKRRIELPEPIKQLGSFAVEVRLHPEVTARVTVHVQRA